MAVVATMKLVMMKLVMLMMKLRMVLILILLSMLIQATLPTEMRRIDEATRTHAPTHHYRRRRRGEYLRPTHHYRCRRYKYLRPARRAPAPKTGRHTQRRRSVAKQSQRKK